MEKRWTGRTLARLSVELQYEQMEIFDCYTRDISFSGAFIETQPPHPNIDKSVDLVFSLGEEDNYTKYTVPAKIVRSEHSGIGVMFRDFDVSSFRTLRELLRNKDANV